MMMEINSEIDNFHLLLENYYRQVGSLEPLQKMRSKAWSHYLELGLPTRKSEVFRYVNLKRLFNNNYVLTSSEIVSEAEIQPLLYPECSESALVFVNGSYQPQLSRTEAIPKKAVILTLQEAFKTYGTFLTNQMIKTLKEETDPFVALNAAIHSQGAFIYLPPKTIVSAPVQIVNIIKTTKGPLHILPRLHLFAGAQSQINLISTQHVIEGEEYFVNRVAEFAIEEEAHVHYMQVAIGGDGNQWNFDSLRASLKRNSTLKTVQMTDGGQGIRHDYRIVLAGENAEALLNGVWMLGDKRESHVHVLMDHQAPLCRSMQLFKGVLNGTSKSSFEGKIYVRQLAQKTEAFQLNHNVVLSDKAIAYSKPNLEIFADDVKASHGATVGQLDEEQLFYMKTRGFEDSEARNLLIYGFCKEIINMISCPSLLREATQWTKKYVNQKG